VLGALEIGQYVLERPSGIAELAPMSKSSAWPRIQTMPLIEDEPPTVIDEQLMIIAVQHGAQQWPERF
jgi:hypothetical protein